MSEIPKVKFSSKKSNKLVGFELLDLKDLFEEKRPSDHNPSELHKLDFFAILLVDKGEANHIVDFEKVILKEGDCLIISKGRAHAFDTTASYDGWLVLFTEEFLHHHLTNQAISKIQSLYNYFVVNTKYHQPDSNATFIKILTEEIESEYMDSKAEIMGAMLSIFLLKLEQGFSEYKDPQDSRSYEYFLSFKELVEKDFNKTRDAKVYADELCISYKHLNEVCKLVVNTTAKAFIDDYVLLESKRLLASTTLSSKEIAYECGFDEPTNFLKFFKKHAGLTPLEFRKTPY